MPAISTTDRAPHEIARVVATGVDDAATERSHTDDERHQHELDHEPPAIARVGQAVERPELAPRVRRPGSGQRHDRSERPRREAGHGGPELGSWGHEQHDGEAAEPDRHRREMDERRGEPEHDRVARNGVAAGGDHPEHAEPEGADHDDSATDHEAPPQRDEHAEQHDHHEASDPPLPRLGVGDGTPRHERPTDEVGLRGDHPQRADDRQLGSHHEEHTDAPGADQPGVDATASTRPPTSSPTPA